MQPYQNITGRSGILSFETGPDYIDVQFEDGGKVYRYSYKSAGAPHVEAMKELAYVGQGLNTYINRHVRMLYEH